MTQNPPAVKLGERKSRTDKSADRTAMEFALQRADHPLSVRELTEATGAEADRVRTILSTMRASDRVTRGEDGDAGEARYVWTGPAEPRRRATTPTPAGPAAEPRDYGHLRAAPYDGRELRAYAGRPGAMDAFAMPSVRNGQRVPRRAPIIMGCTPAPKKPGT